MSTVTSKSELEAALKRGDSQIIIQGELAEKIQKQMKRKKATRIAGGALTVGALVTAPLTGGATIPGAVAGAAVAVSAGEVIAAMIVLFAGSLGTIALLKNYEVIKVNLPGGVGVELRKKS